jgi:hypothetical protein
MILAEEGRKKRRPVKVMSLGKLNTIHSAPTSYRESMNTFSITSPPPSIEEAGSGGISKLISQAEQAKIKTMCLALHR